jgi:hypothetical protein
MQVNQSKGVKLKMRECTFRTHLNWQGALKQKDVKQTGLKQGLGVLTASHFCTKVIADFLEEHQKHYNVVGNFFVHIQISSHDAHLFYNAGCCLYDSHF